MIPGVPLRSVVREGPGRFLVEVVHRRESPLAQLAPGAPVVLRAGSYDTAEARVLRVDVARHQVLVEVPPGAEAVAEGAVLLTAPEASCSS